MLDSFRKYTGLMFVVLILLFLGLVFFGTGQQGLVSGPTVLKADGRSFSEQDRNRLAVNPARLLRQLAGNPYQNFQRFAAIEPYLRRMGVVAFSGVPLETEQVQDYLVNRLSLHKAMDEFGVHVSTAEAEQFLKERIFVAPDGTFDDVGYSEFVKNSLSGYGMGVKDMNTLIGEVIAIEKLEEIMGSGIAESPDVVKANYLAQQQRIDYQLVTVQISSFEADQNPTEEEIKKYWEENKGNYLTEPLRRVTYLIERPDYTALEEEAAKEKAEGEGGDNPAEAEPGDEPAADNAVPKEKRDQAVRDLGNEIDMMWDLLQDDEGKTPGKLETLAQDRGYKVQSTGLLKKDEFPADLKAALRSVAGKTGTDAIFSHDPGENDFDATSDVLPIGSDQWLLFRIDEAVEPKELPFEEARDSAKLDLVKKLAKEAMEKDAKEKREALAAALAEGKGLAEAAKDLDLTPIPRLDQTRSQQPGAAQAEFDLAAKTNPNSLSEVSTQEDKNLGITRSFMVYVDKRVTHNDEGLDQRIEVRTEQESQQLRGLALDNWFEQQKIAANVKVPTS